MVHFVFLPGWMGPPSIDLLSLGFDTTNPEGLSRVGGDGGALGIFEDTKANSGSILLARDGCRHRKLVPWLRGVQPQESPNTNTEGWVTNVLTESSARTRCYRHTGTVADYGKWQQVYHSNRWLFYQVDRGVRYARLDSWNGGAKVDGPIYLPFCYPWYHPHGSG